MDAPHRAPPFTGPRRPKRSPGRWPVEHRLVAVGLVAAVALLSSFVHLVNAAVERGDAVPQAINVTSAPR